ncbi:MAG: MBL fold metallo-hydrolase, partial [Gillisia sp.]
MKLEEKILSVAKDTISIEAKAIANLGNLLSEEFALLIDCGDQNQVERLTLPLLRSRGVNSLPRLVLTHGDVRHAGGVAMLAEALSIQEVVVSPHDSRSPSYRDFVNRIRESGTRDGTALREVVPGDEVAGWRVRLPPADIRFPRAD